MKALCSTSDKAGEMAVLVRRFENMGKAQTKEEAVSESEDGDQAEEANEDDGADG